MRSLIVALALVGAVACTGEAFAADQSPQPFTKTDCDKAGMHWDDNANVCGADKAPAASIHGDHHHYHHCWMKHGRHHCRA